MSVTTVLAGLLVSVASVRAYRANAGALEALSLLEQGLVQVDPITLDGRPATLDRLLDGVSAQLDDRKNLNRAAAGQVHYILASLYFRQDPRRGPNLEKAVKHYGIATQVFEKEYGSRDARTIEAKNDLAMALSKSGNVVEARKILEEVLSLRAVGGDEHGRLISLGNHAVALFREGRGDEAMAEFAEVVGGFLKAGNAYEGIKAVAWQARVLMEAGYLADAERIQREALRRTLEVGPLFADLSLAIMDGLTYNLIAQRSWLEAKAELSRMRAFVDTSAAADHKSHRMVLTRLKRVHGELGEKSELSAAERDLEAWEAQYGGRS